MSSGPHAPTLTLATFSAGERASLWEQAFPVAAWRAVLGAGTVTVHVNSGSGSTGSTDATVATVATVATDGEGSAGSTDSTGSTGSADGAALVLMGSRDGRREALRPLTAGSHEICLAREEHDWLWIDGDVRTVAWTVERSVELAPVTVVMPTFRREEDAVAQAGRFARMECVHQVIVVDQGGSLAEHPGFLALQESAPGVRLISQPNLGGSGGYARGMLCSQEFPEDSVLLSDDDAVISEESLLRMATYQALAAQPTILGTPLFSAQEPLRLIALSEAVRANDFQWHAADGVRAPVDLTGTSPEDWDFLRPRGEANYTGWWATLFPPGTVAELGLPAPFFLKWDDAEYGLRATRRGYRHVVLPGTSVHHPPWDAYRTQMSWTSRVLHRNRLATAAAYSPRRGVILSSLVHQCKHILSGHHLTAALWDDGIEGFLAGPSAWLGHDLERARAEGQEIVTRWHEDHPVAASELPPARRAPLPFVPAVLRAALRLVTPDRAPRVVVEVTAEELHWHTTMGADAFVVTGAGVPDGTAHLVQGSTARSLLLGTLRRHLRMALRWSSLHRRYERDLPRATTERAWSALFDRAGSSPEAERGR